MPSKPALLALGCSLALFAAIAGTGFWRIDSHAADVAQAPPGGPALQPSAVASAAGTLAPPPASPAVDPAATDPLQAAPAPQAAEPVAAPVRPTPAASATPEQAELRIVAYPFGDVWVDEKYLGASPLTVRVGPGVHSLAVGEGRPRERRSVTLRAGERSRVIFGDPRPDAVREQAAEKRR